MRLVRSAAAMQRRARQWQRRGVRVGLVPTMGYLHEGHLSLIRAARRRVGAAGQVVVSIYVNPTQFGPREDLSRYPRDLRRDVQRCRAAGVDVVFAPTDGEMYPGQAEDRYSTYVVENQLAQSMEGATRPTHFRGVTTVVTKLFNLVLPTLAVFGAKDWQQAAIIKRMVVDLNFPVKIVVCPIVREADGLALSSRNKYLIGDVRPQATVLWKSLQAARRKVAAVTRPVPAAQLQMIVNKTIHPAPDARLDYVEFFDPDTLQPRARVTRGTHMALAVFFGKTRLIDNGRL